MKSKLPISVVTGLLFCLYLQAQNTKRVLFVGNSYVYTNNLPLMLSNLANAHGDSVFYDSSAPGGYTFQQHCNNATTLFKIAQGNWDYVALQEQSQIPSFPPAQVAADCLPYAHTLDSLVHAADSCTESVFFMTWGRKNGDASNCASYPPLCTYAGMQGRLRESYLLLAQQNNASVAPVGCAWREVRNQNPLFDLYVSDESHPTVYGSYVAACIFYSTFFKKPVSSLSYTAGIPMADAALIQQQCNLIMFDSLQTWFAAGNIPFASFTQQQSLATCQFTNTSLNGSAYSWNFGDGTTSAQTNPLHTYTTNGMYVVKLTAFSGCDSSVVTDTIHITTVSVSDMQTQSALQLVYKNNRMMLMPAQGKEIFELELFTAGGNLVAKKILNATLKLHVQEGVYLVSVSASDKVFTGKLVVGANGNGMASLLAK